MHEELASIKAIIRSLEVRWHYQSCGNAYILSMRMIPLSRCKFKVALGQRCCLQTARRHETGYIFLGMLNIGEHVIEQTCAL